MISLILKRSRHVFQNKKKIDVHQGCFYCGVARHIFIWLLCIVLEFWEHISQYRVPLFTLCTIHESLTPPPIPSGPYRQGSKYSCVRMYFSSTFQENWNFLYSIPILSVQRASNFWRNHVNSDADFFLECMNEFSFVWCPVSNDSSLYHSGMGRQLNDEGPLLFLKIKFQFPGHTSGST